MSPGSSFSWLRGFSPSVLVGLLEQAHDRPRRSRMEVTPLTLPRWIQQPGLRSRRHCIPCGSGLLVAEPLEVEAEVEVGLRTPLDPGLAEARQVPLGFKRELRTETEVKAAPALEERPAVPADRAAEEAALEEVLLSSGVEEISRSTTPEVLLVSQRTVETAETVG